VQILDYSAGYPGAKAIKAAGFGGVIRYLRKEGSSRVQPITRDELADMRAHGLAVALVYQAISTSRILEGRRAGEHDARWAQARAAELGLPDAVIYFAADRDIVGGQMASVLAYLDGAAAVIGRDRAGVYGEADVIDAAVPDHAAYGWQTAAWSRARRSTKAHLFQRIGQPTVGGITVDVNDVLAPDWGQIDQEDDMPTAAEIARAVHGYRNPDVKPKGDAYWYQRETYAQATRAAQLAAANQAALAALARDPDITRDVLAAEVDAAVERHTPTAEQVAAAQLPHIQDAVREVLGEDNADQADAIIRALGTRLTVHETEETQPA
jgi:hypothetical protein